MQVSFPLFKFSNLVFAWYKFYSEFPKMKRKFWKYSFFSDFFLLRLHLLIVHSCRRQLSNWLWIRGGQLNIVAHSFPQFVGHVSRLPTLYSWFRYRKDKVSSIFFLKFRILSCCQWNDSHIIHYYRTTASHLMGPATKMVFGWNTVSGLVFFTFPEWERAKWWEFNHFLPNSSSLTHQVI